MGRSFLSAARIFSISSPSLAKVFVAILVSMLCSFFLRGIISPLRFNCYNLLSNQLLYFTHIAAIWYTSGRLDEVWVGHFIFVSPYRVWTTPRFQRENCGADFKDKMPPPYLSYQVSFTKVSSDHQKKSKWRKCLVSLDLWPNPKKTWATPWLLPMSMV